MANEIKLTFAGDADKLSAEAKKAVKSTESVGDAATKSSKDIESAGKSTDGLGEKLGHLGSATDGASTAVDGVSSSIQAFADLQDFARARASKMERALNDVQQAQEDYNQAIQDGKQALQDGKQADLDKEQALLDQKTAADAYKDAVKKYGANSDEARQANLDLKQAGLDVEQAEKDKEQALRDSNQAVIDAKGATTDLSDAQHEVDSGPMQALADVMGIVGPVMQGLIGIMALVTAGQWLWNTALFASPITWIVLGILALIAVIVLIATQTAWFQEAWSAAWGWIKSAAEAVWDWLKQVPGWIGDAFAIVGDVISKPFRVAFDTAKTVATTAWDFIKQIPGWVGTAFGKISDAISAPFRAAFNFVARAWNNTIGSLSWTVPDWVPGIGGSSIGAPRLPTFHTGGVVPGAPGSEVLALLQAGETVIPANQSGGGQMVLTVASGADQGVATLINWLVRTGKLDLARA